MCIFFGYRNSKSSRNRIVLRTFRTQLVVITPFNINYKKCLLKFIFEINQPQLIKDEALILSLKETRFDHLSGFFKFYLILFVFHLNYNKVGYQVLNFIPNLFTR